MSGKEKSILIGTVAVIIALMLIMVAYEEKTVVDSLTPEQRTEFSSFRTRMDDLQAGDLVEMKYEGRDSLLHEGTFIVEEHGQLDELILRGPGPGSNPELHRVKVNFLNPYDRRDLFYRVKGITRRQDPGWQTLHQWFALQ